MILRTDTATLSLSRLDAMIETLLRLKREMHDLPPGDYRAGVAEALRSNYHRRMTAMRLTPEAVNAYHIATRSLTNPTQIQKANALKTAMRAHPYHKPRK